MYILLFLIILVLYSAKIIPTLKFKKYAIYNHVKDLKERDVVLSFDEEGLTEIINGIVSKAPWSSVVNFVLYKGNLFIALASSLWAIVPNGSLSAGSDTIDEAVEYLQSKNVPNQIKK